MKKIKRNYLESNRTLKKGNQKRSNINLKDENKKKTGLDPELYKFHFEFVSKFI